ncbi:hypothetical protein [Ensifer canadensis]
MSQMKTYPSMAYVPTDWFCMDGLKTFVSIARLQADALTTIFESQIYALNQLSLLWDAPLSELVEELYLTSSPVPGERGREGFPIPAEGDEGTALDLQRLSC